MTTKTCTKCGTERDEERFELRYDGTNKRKSHCKPCRNADQARQRWKKSHKQCKQCGEDRTLKHFERTYMSSLGLDDHRGVCKLCRNENLRVMGMSNTQRWKMLAGGECIRCGYNKCLAALDWHHRDSGTKIKGVLSNIHRVNPDSKGKWQNSVALEIAKCDLVCANCHREIHDLTG